MNNVISWFVRPFRFAVLERHLQRSGRSVNAPLRVLDVGCGQTSPTLTCREFPNCEYHAIDLLDPTEVLAAHGERIAANYRRLNLESDGLVPVSGPFDIIVISHVFEHICNGLDILEQAADLLSENGLLFVEYPRLSSVNLPSMDGTLNFYDDPTHKRFHSLVDVANTMAARGLIVREARTRRYWRRILLTPAGAAYSLLRHGHLRAGAFWDILGFAEYAVGHKAATRISILARSG